MFAEQIASNSWVELSTRKYAPGQAISAGWPAFTTQRLWEYFWIFWSAMLSRIIAAQWSITPSLKPPGSSLI